MRVPAFLVVTAIVEIGVGLFLLVLPASPLSVLLGIRSDTPELLLVGRLVGAALIAIGVVSGMARDDPGGPALRGVLSGILVYDVAAAVLLAYAGAGLQMAGPVLWPAALLHAGLAVWCLLCLRSILVP